MDSNKQALLADPFDPEDVEWRVQQSGLSGKGEPWVMVIAYITNRAIQKRLDDVFGVGGWQNVYQPTHDSKGYLCGIKAKIDGEWVTKWDGAEMTDIEPVKGGLSNSMKRAAVQWGIGRYLYSLDVEFAPCKACDNRYQAAGNYIFIKNKNGGPGQGAEWTSPNLPEWALPSLEKDNLLKAIDEAPDIESLKAAWVSARNYATNFKRAELVEQFQKAAKARKAAIVAEMQEESERNFDKVQSWLNSQLDDLIRCAANESSLGASQSSIQKQIRERVKEGEARDLLTRRLNEVTKARYEQLNQESSNA